MPYLEKYSERKLLICLITAIAGVFIVSGCGRKGLPVAPGAPDLSPVAGVSYKIEGGAVTISWDKPDSENASILTGYTVHRSITRIGDESCDGCPVLFQRIAKLGKESTSYRESLETGNKYIYKVVSVSKYGTISPDSIFVTFEF